MLVHVFGANSFPAAGNFSLRRTATDNKHCFPEDVIKPLKRNFYVDETADHYACPRITGLAL